jgi:hypothetical protein
MKEQRWPGDYQTVPEEFRSSLRQEQVGMAGINASHGHDYLTMGEPYPMDRYQIGELEPSFATQLDTNGMQPHAREYLERNMTGMVSARKFHMVDGQMIDHCEGIQFSGMP